MNVTHKSFDVLVVGGGPSGAAFSLTLRRHSSLSVAVIEKSNYDTPRIGETLPPGTHSLLHYLGVWNSFASNCHLTSFGTAGSWGTPNLATRDFITTPHGNGWHLNRGLFDETLAKHAEESGVFLLRNTVAQCNPHPTGGWMVEAKRNNTSSSIQASFIVDATGIAATVARTASARRSLADRMVGVCATIHLDESPPRDTFTLVETFDSGWWYSATLPGSRAIAVLMTDPDLVRAHGWTNGEHFWAVLHTCPHTWKRLKNGRAIAPPRVVPAFSAHLTPVYGRDWIAVGDAAASYDPLSSSGLARALDSGIRAALAVQRYFSDHQTDELSLYNRYIQTSFAQYLFYRQRYYQMEQRWPHSSFWASRHNDRS